MADSIEIDALYSDGKFVKNGDGSSELYRNEIEWQGNINDRLHKVRIGENAKSIAAIIYNDFTENPQKLFWLIMDANKEISNPFDLSEFVGKQIIIPSFFFYQLNKEQ